MTFLETYNKKIAGDLMKSLNLDNVHEVPAIKAVVLNVGMGRLLKDKKDYSEITKNIVRVSGQKPVVTLAKKSISNFKLREGMPVGMKVTLRGKRMYDFIEKLISVVLPRIRDFKGISDTSFDEEGNYHFGVKEIGIFPDIAPDELKENHGLQISLLTNTNNKEHVRALLKAFSFPFTNKN